MIYDSAELRSIAERGELTWQILKTFRKDMKGKVYITDCSDFDYDAYEKCDVEEWINTKKGEMLDKIKEKTDKQLAFDKKELKTTGVEVSITTYFFKRLESF